MIGTLPNAVIRVAATRQILAALRGRSSNDRRARKVEAIVKRTPKIVTAFNGTINTLIACCIFST
jgi:hypothetical protein